jgi:hypothetical protein
MHCICHISHFLMLVKYNVSKLKKAMTLPQTLNRLLSLKLFSPQF